MSTLQIGNFIFRADCTGAVASPANNAKEVQSTKSLPSQDNFSILTIGDIGITSDKVITPNGIGTLADSQWIFSDMSRTESKIPATAVILAIVFALLCLIGLPFLLMTRNHDLRGMRKSRCIAAIFTTKFKYQLKAKQKWNRIRELVNKAQSLAALARANR